MLEALLANHTCDGFDCKSGWRLCAANNCRLSAFRTLQS